MFVKIKSKEIEIKCHLFLHGYPIDLASFAETILSSLDCSDATVKCVSVGLIPNSSFCSADLYMLVSHCLNYS